ncbi:MAG: putative oxidoreductase [Verrucomicrobiales bacterium]|jgi:predicted oxidoreductase
MPMQRVKLSPEGPEVSRLVFGWWRAQDDPDGSSPDRILAKVHRCLELGITTMDHADIYGLYENEELFGAALKQEPSLRDKIEIITKCGISVPSEGKPNARLPHYDSTAKNIVACAERSLQKLGVDHIDLLLIHRPDWLSTAELVTNQVEVHLLKMDALYDGSLHQCEQARIRPMAWSPMAGGRLFDPENEAATRIRAACAELSEKYGGATVDQFAFAWLLAHPSGMVPVIGTNSLDRIDSAAKSAEIVLERQDWYALWQAAMGQSVP